MLGFLGKLFGSEKAIEKGIETVSSGIDKLFYTDEERAEDGRKERSEARAMIIGWMQATSGQNLARRLLALVITSVWLLMYVVSAVLDVCVVWMTDYADKLTVSANAIGERAMQMNGAMMLIIGFYFAAPHLSSIVPAAIEKFSGKKKEE